MKKRMKQLCALMLAGAMVLGAAGCGGNSSSSAETDSGEGSAAAAADNTMYISVEQESTSTDKVEFPWYNLRLPCILMYRGLVLANPAETEFTGDLAESYEMSEDGLTYTFQMKEGLKWSDGEDLTAEDVVWSIETALKAAQVASTYTTCFSYIQGAQEYIDGTADSVSGMTIDGNTLTITLTDSYAYFLTAMGQFSILPKHCLEDEDPLNLYQSDFWAAPVTSGYYKFDEMTAGSYYTLSINENYEGEKTQIENVVCNFVSSQTTAITSGASDYAFTNSSSDIEVMNADENLTAYYNEYLFYKYLIFNMSGVDGNENAAMQNPLVREAVAYAIDRDALAALYGDVAKVIYNGVPVSDEDNDGMVYEYDPEKAKALLDEAGWDYDYTVRILYYNDDETSQNIIAAICQYLQDIGMKVESTYTSQGTQDLFTTRNYDIGFKGTGPMDAYYSEYMSSSSTFQNIYGGDTAFDESISKLMSATNDEEETAAKTELQQIEEEKLYKVPIMTLGYYTYLNTSRLNVPEDLDMGTPGHRCDIQFTEWSIK